MSERARGECDLVRLGTVASYVSKSQPPHAHPPTLYTFSLLLPNRIIRIPPPRIDTLPSPHRPRHNRHIQRHTPLHPALHIRMRNPQPAKGHGVNEPCANEVLRFGDGETGVEHEVGFSDEGAVSGEYIVWRGAGTACVNDALAVYQRWCFCFWHLRSIHPFSPHTSPTSHKSPSSCLAP